MTMHASGTFEVKLIPQDDRHADKACGRMLIDKQLHGDLEGVGEGQMLVAMTDIKESGGYVAIERITGTLHGHKGSFLLQHTGTMTRGAHQLSIRVVPDSGTGELAGLTGQMTIKIEDGKHYYQFSYSLAQTQ